MAGPFAERDWPTTGAVLNLLWEVAMNESFNPAVPLLALDAVGIDTETTGLDVRRDRIVQLGSVAISAGAVVSNETVEILVNPHVAVPPSSTAPAEMATEPS
jgi:DNA polymerase III epsilon subunit-like protein